MQLGIMVTTDQHAAQVSGIALAALARGHAVTIFLTDTGTRLLADARLVALARLPRVAMSYCAQSAALHGAPGGLPEAVVAGSQFDNALLAAGADKLLVL
jgi:peroxiredoxin family protein